MGFVLRWGIAGAWMAGVCAAQAASPPARKEQAGRAILVYAADFEQPVEVEWSHRKIDAAPNGTRRFLGQFGNDQVTLTLRRLPGHRYLRISFELLVLRTWDGTTADGPDEWSLRVRGGPELLRASFANVQQEKQTFPDGSPGPLHPPRTGAAKVRTLGYKHPPEGPDAVYELSCVFAHTAAEVTFVFAGRGLQPPSDESWGLDTVKVEALPAGRPLDRQAITALWEQLGGKDPVKACGAIPPLVLAGEPAAEFLAERLPAKIVDVRAVRKVIAELDAESWKTREAATAKLRAMGDAVAGTLREALAKPASLEAKSRLEHILNALKAKGPGWSDPARHHRVLRVLAAGRGPQTLQALKRLRGAAKGKALAGRAEAAMLRVAADLMEPLLAGARGEAAAGRLAAAAGCQRAAGVAVRAGHAAARPLAELSRRLRAGAAGARESAALWSAVDKALAAERARVESLRSRKRDAQRPAGKPQPPLPPDLTPPVEGVDLFIHL